MKLLCAHGADPNRVGGAGVPPIVAAVYYGANVDLLQALVSAGADGGATSTTGFTAAHNAAWHGKLEQLIYVVGPGGCPHDSPDSLGRTPLAVACFASKLREISYLLDLGCDVNHREMFGSTPLHYCCYNRFLAGVQDLLSHGAHPDIQCQRGATPLWYAVCFRAYDVVCRLVQENVRLSQASCGAMLCNLGQVSAEMYPLYRTPLEMAFLANHSLIFATLVVAGCDFKGEAWWDSCEVAGKPETFMQVYKWACSVPTKVMSLKSLCRRCVRQVLGCPMTGRLKTLFVPTMLRNYLLFEELADSVLPELINKTGVLETTAWSQHMDEFL